MLIDVFVLKHLLTGASKKDDPKGPGRLYFYVSIKPN